MRANRSKRDLNFNLKGLGGLGGISRAIHGGEKGLVL